MLLEISSFLTTFKVILNLLCTIRHILYNIYWRRAFEKVSVKHIQHKRRALTIDSVLDLFSLLIHANGTCRLHAKLKQNVLYYSYQDRDHQKKNPWLPKVFQFILIMICYVILCLLEFYIEESTHVSKYLPVGVQ
jgi:hypothetical protein